MDDISLRYFKRWPMLYWFLRLIRFRYASRRRVGHDYVFDWGEVSPIGGLVFKVSVYEDYATLIVLPVFFQFIIRIPMPSRSRFGKIRAGFSFTNHTFGFNDVHIYWGSKMWIINMPWDLTHYRTSTLISMEDDVWHHSFSKVNRKLARQKIYGSDKAEIEAMGGPWTQDIPFTLVLKDGTTQKSVATLSWYESEHRRRCLQFLPLFRSVQRYLKIDFHDEMGAERGSWKGGVLGTTCLTLPGQTPAEAFKKYIEERGPTL